MKILLLGSTGSIGVSACNCIRRFADRFSIVGIAANRSIELLAAQAAEFRPVALCVGDPDSVIDPTRFSGNITIYRGEQGLLDLVNNVDYDLLLNALVGAVGFKPTIAALRRGKRVALANKESLVIGGDLITALLADRTDALVPIDSEHSAILQCLQGERIDSIESIILTASGGPFRELDGSKFGSITPDQALCHPTWCMGKKITIDSATLINKGFEVIEAHHLFALSYDRISVLIHPQSIIHSMVEFHDGAVMAQLGLPDMELPIQYALSFPQRLPLQPKRLKLSEIKHLTFDKPDLSRFPCLRLCIEAGQAGLTMPTVLNAANEVAVNLFLQKKIGFTDIARIIEKELTNHTPTAPDSEATIDAIDRQTRERVFSQYSQ